jgi:hypothetical protein
MGTNRVGYRPETIGHPTRLTIVVPDPCRAHYQLR